jgi:protein-S-isoprenylcysteine O-methyltransferase Ste14
MARIMTLLYGAIVYLFFLVTFLYTIGFVEGIPGIKAIDTGPTDGVWTSLTVDVLLLGVFAVQHSVMARRGFKRWWTGFIPPAVERSTYVLAASLAVALLLWQWRPIPSIVWAVDNPSGRILLYLISALGWVTLLTSTFLINHFELFGLQQVFNYWRGARVEPAAFKTPALYKYVRHPLYLGFILAFWATPRMTQGHLLFAAATTAYIFVGIFFEERDLIAHFGDEYRRYRQRVPMILPFRRQGTNSRGPQRRPGSQPN